MESSGGLRHLVLASAFLGGHRVSGIGKNDGRREGERSQDDPIAHRWFLSS
jgi:hypothetical protein